MEGLGQVSKRDVYKFKPKFIERFSALTDFEQFKTCSLTYLRRSIRVNTLMASVKEVKKTIEAKGWKLEQIPWCKEGFWISHPQPGEIVLDLCAAPGSKTTQMGAMMQNKGLIVANDYKGERLQSLGINLQKSMLTNVIVSLMSGERMKGLQFDKILVDAPCSGTGAIRKSLKTINIWNPHMITKLAQQQKAILENAFSILKPDGELVYSTCSVEPEEDEGVVDYLINKYPNAQVLKVKTPGLKTSPAVLEFEGKKYNPQIKNTLRIWPQDNDTEGFFVAKIKKKG